MRLIKSGGEQIDLPDDLLWTEEFQWSPVVAVQSYTLTGALVIDQAVRRAGRPISLVGPADMAWVTRQTVRTLHAWAAEADARAVLALRDGRQFTVAFRHADGAIEAEPVLGLPAWRDGDWYRLTLRLVEI